MDQGSSDEALDDLLLQKLPHLSWLLRRKRQIEQPPSNNGTSNVCAGSSRPAQYENGTKNGNTSHILDYIPLGQPTEEASFHDSRHNGADEHPNKRRRLEEVDHLQRVSDGDKKSSCYTLEHELFARPAPTLPSFLKHSRPSTAADLSTSLSTAPLSASPPRPTVAVLSPVPSQVPPAVVQPSVTSSTATLSPARAGTFLSSPARSSSPSSSPARSSASSPVRQTTSQPAATRLSPQVLSATKLSDTRSPPWAHKDRLYSPPAQSEDQPRPDEFYRALGQEVKDLAEWVSPTLYEWKARYEALNRVTQTIRGIWPHANVHLFGSSKTKLCLSGSDIDLVVTGATPTPWNVSPLRALAAAIRKQQPQASNLGGLKVIDNAKVPIIKMIDWSTQIAIDICLDNTSGPISSEILICTLQDLPHLKPLALVLKYFLRQQKMNETFEGGMGSYLLVLLLIHVIQKRRKKDEEERIRALALNQIRAKADLIREKLLTEQGIDSTQAKEQAQSDNGRTQSIAEPTADDDELLGRLFADFFFEIGVNLDYSQGISVRESGSLFDKSTRYPFCENLYLAVEDPENSDKDVGKGCWNIEGVRQLLAEAYQRLIVGGRPPGTAPCRKPGEKSILCRIIWPDSTLEEIRKRYEKAYTQAIDIHVATSKTPAAAYGKTTAIRGGRGGARGRGAARGMTAGIGGGRGGASAPNPHVGFAARYAPNVNYNYYNTNGRGGHNAFHAQAWPPSGYPAYYARGQ